MPKAVPDLTAEAALTAADPKLGALIEKVVAAHGPRRYARVTKFTPFEMVARAIVFQQLSGKAATTIWGRFAALCPNGKVTPEAIAALPDAAIRGAGISTQKLGYLRDLSAKSLAGAVDFPHIKRLPDEEVIAELTRIKGVGRWTAQMFLMFTLCRPDVIAEGDLGVQKGLQIAHRKRKLPSPDEVRKAAEKWRPHRSLACLYLWAVQDLKVL